ncbi:hypothetical protein MTO98_22940 [Mucilaginibacter sp. SMC90]|uniref:hypothetical protein n=1 Tax=Mucilaginibacter sp. SMC90 TaxID=2929803 RepID=UPI001FB4F42B|nr:hypothetical protein [Mucilaginibacter sp. SMC90]UOE47265.1 hypothetical protein MTO98_22940 [Mucilaginibacter sp. SMC90]
MKVLITALFLIIQVKGHDNLAGSTWNYEVVKGCVNTLTIKKNGRVEEFDCELNYTFNGTYKLSNDTLNVVTKDDSHSEDHGKITYHRAKYLIAKNALYCIGYGELVNGKWQDKKYKLTNEVSYTRSK